VAARVSGAYQNPERAGRLSEDQRLREISALCLKHSNQTSKSQKKHISNWAASPKTIITAIEGENIC